MSQRIDLWQLWRTLIDRNVLLLAISYMCMNYVFYMLSNWCFLYLVQELHFSELASGWLATANYLGYLAGALICMAVAVRPVRAIRGGLVGVAVLTVAMGLGGSPLLWFAFRFFAGVASAFVLVGVSAWAMPILARSFGRSVLGSPTEIPSTRISPF